MLGLCQAQISEVGLGENTLIGKVVNVIECTKTVTSIQTIYVFTYKDAQYSGLNIYNSFRVDSNEDFENLYEKIIENISKEKKENVMLDLGNGHIIMLRFDGLRKNFVQIAHSKNGVSMGITRPISRKKIDVLFGK